jgi:hypothetical protein
MRQHANKGERYARAIADCLGPPAATRLKRRLLLEPDAVRHALLMGPNAHTLAGAALDIDAQPLEVTLDMVVVFARKPQ